MRTKLGHHNRQVRLFSKRPLMVLWVICFLLGTRWRVTSCSCLGFALQANRLDGLDLAVQRHNKVPAAAKTFCRFKKSLQVLPLAILFIRSWPRSPPSETTRVAQQFKESNGRKSKSIRKSKIWSLKICLQPKTQLGGTVRKIQNFKFHFKSIHSVLRCSLIGWIYSACSMVSTELRFMIYCAPFS